MPLLVLPKLTVEFIMAQLPNPAFTSQQLSKTSCDAKQLIVLGGKKKKKKKCYSNKATRSFSLGVCASSTASISIMQSAHMHQKAN